jgi:hypothetical protein
MWIGCLDVSIDCLVFATVSIKHEKKGRDIKLLFKEAQPGRSGANRPQALHHHRTPEQLAYLRLVRVSVVRFHKDPVYHHQVRASTMQSVTCPV